MERIKSLDGLRGAAVIAVLVSHLPSIEGFDNFNMLFTLFKKTGIGYIGVELFFILSGFLITSNIIKGLNQPNFLRHFYYKRVLRLAPVSLLTIAACVIIFPNYEYFYNIFFLSNYYFSYDASPHPLRHFWSLAVEEQFYFIWPIVLLLTLLNKTRLGIIISVLVIASLTVTIIRDVVYNDTISHDLIYRSLETRMASLLIGCALAIYGIPKIAPLKLLLVGMGAFVLSCVFIVWGKNNHLVPTHSIKAVCLLVCCACVFILAVKSKVVSRIFSQSVLCYFGMISYGLYVYHLPIFYYFGISHMQGGVSDIPTLLLALILTGGVTLLSWYFMESKLLGLKPKKKIAIIQTI